MKTLLIDDHNQGIFSHKLGDFFPIFEKEQGRPPSSFPPLVTRLWIQTKSLNICQFII